MQQIPRGLNAGGCEIFWAQWGRNRVRILAHDQKTRAACITRRDGFYLHDSVKGFSHGCIEVEPRFFFDLYDYIDAMKRRRLQRREQLLLRVAYIPGRTTYGGTRLQWP